MKDRIDARLNGVASEIVHRWPEDFDPPNRSTVSRWLNKPTFPRTEDRLIILADILDLDPLALLQFIDSSFERELSKVAKASRTGQWDEGFPFALKILQHVVSPKWEWPPGVDTYLRRDWHSVGFSHIAEKGANFFASLQISASQIGELDGDQIFYFAWRGNGVSKRWSPYGFVRARGDLLSLYSFDGSFQHVSLDPQVSKFFVETYFGEGSAEFKVVSLHQFDLHLCQAPGSGPTVRFR